MIEKLQEAFKARRMQRKSYRAVKFFCHPNSITYDAGSFSNHESGMPETSKSMRTFCLPFVRDLA